MYPAGYRKDSFKPGDEVTVTVDQARVAYQLGRIWQVILANGTKLGGLSGGVATDASEAPKPE